MKNIIKVIVILVTFLFFFNCDSNDDNPSSENYAQLIIGEWAYLKYEVIKNDEIIDSGIADSCSENFRLFFTDDGEFIWIALADENNCDLAEYSLPYYFIDNELFVVGNNGDIPQIIEINNNILIFSGGSNYPIETMLQYWKKVN